MLEQISPPECNRILWEHSKDVIEFLKEQGWTEEARLWVKKAIPITHGMQPRNFSL